MAEGFRTVLELVMKYQSLRIYWKKYYDFSDPTIKSYLTKKLAKSRYPESPCKGLFPWHVGAALWMQGLCGPTNPELLPGPAAIPDAALSWRHEVSLMRPIFQMSKLRFWACLEMRRGWSRF